MNDAGSFYSWKTELPNLTNGSDMFCYCSGLESWSIELPNLTNGEGMLSYSGLTSFSSHLPSLHSASNMFADCQLNIESLRCIAEGISDVNGSSVGDHAITIGLSSEAFAHPDKEKYVELLESKGWRVAL